MEKEEKKSFVLYNDLINIVEQLPDETSGKLFKYILRFVNEKEVEIDDLLLKIAFQPIKDSIIRNSKKWEDSKEKKSEAGRIGNLKRWNKDLYDHFIRKEITLEEAENIAKNRTATNAIAKIAVNDNISVIGSVSGNVSVNDSVSVIHNNNINNINSSNEESMFVESENKIDETNSSIKSEKEEKEKNCAKKEKEIETQNLVQEIFEAWNDTKILVHRKFEKPKLILDALKKISKDELLDSFKNYRIILDDQKHYFKHRWPLETVLKKQQGKAMANYLRFLPNGDIYENYQTFLSTQNGAKQQSNINSQENNIREYANYDLAGRMEQLTSTSEGGDSWEKV
ncbi:DUF6291 domain-containing protein [Empedobacter falsenii]|uniref:DUF6291 domain-containing protein n=1 Tax=Empedobacter falsenii TaxID=343874 RepID=UPI003A7FB61E